MDLDAQLKEMAADLEGKSKQEVKDALEAFGTKNKDIIANAVKSATDSMESKMKAIQEHADALDIKLQAKTKGETVKTTAMELKEHSVDLKAMSTKNSNKEISVKADTVRSTINGNQQARELDSIGQLATRKLTMYDAFVKIPVSESNNNGVIRYYDWDQDTINRAAAMVAEGGSFPESTAAWVTETIALKKIGDTLPVSEEFFEDEAMFAAELGQFLNTNVDLEVDDQIANGNGTGNNLKGLMTSIPTYTASASGIQDASIYDLFPKVKEDITTTGGSKYMPNIAFMNIADINKYKLKKDANNNYVMPPFVSRDGEVIDGVTVIESNVITADTMALGDNRFGRIYEKPGVVLSQGEINAQFTSDMTTLKARRRLLFLIRGADAPGWRKVDGIAAALLTLAS